MTNKMNIYIYIYIFFFFTSVNLKTIHIFNIIYTLPKLYWFFFFFTSFNQFWVQIRALIVLGDSELWNESKTHPPVLKAELDATVETGIANTSWAIWKRS